MTKSDLFSSETFQALTSVCAMIITTDNCNPNKMAPSMHEDVTLITLCMRNLAIKSGDIINHMNHIGFVVSDIDNDPFIIKFKPKSK